jgi:hypothetical protein
MSKAFKIALLCGILAALFTIVPLSAAESPAAPAPVPGQIRTAKRIFISNLGADAISAPVFRKEGEVDKTYNHFYAAMKAWGHYTLVDNPDDADQVFEIRFITSLSGTGKIDSFMPELVLTIVDAKTHFTLWTVAEPVEGAFLKSTWDKNFNRGMSTLVDDLKALTAPDAAATNK